MNHAKAQLDARYRVEVTLCYPVAEALVDTLRVQCGIEAKIKAPYFKERSSKMEYEIALNAIFSSKEWGGGTVIGFSKKAFKHVIEKMVGEELGANADHWVQDGALELQNMVLNKARAALHAKGHEVQWGVPCVVIGQAFCFHQLCQNEVIAIPVQTPMGDITIEFASEKRG